MDFKPTEKDSELGLICIDKNKYAMRSESAIKETEGLEPGKFISQKRHTVKLHALTELSHLFMQILIFYVKIIIITTTIIKGTVNNMQHLQQATLQGILYNLSQ